MHSDFSSVFATLTRYFSLNSMLLTSAELAMVGVEDNVQSDSWAFGGDTESSYNIFQLESIPSITNKILTLLASGIMHSSASSKSEMKLVSGGSVAWLQSAEPIGSTSLVTK